MFWNALGIMAGLVWSVVFGVIALISLVVGAIPVTLIFGFLTFMTIRRVVQIAREDP